MMYAMGVDHLVLADLTAGQHVLSSCYASYSYLILERDARM